MSIIDFYPGKPQTPFSLRLQDVAGYTTPDYERGLENSVYLLARKLELAKSSGKKLNGVVVSLSGGVDSSTTAMASKKALETYGSGTKLVCVTIGLDPDNDLEQEDLAYARRLCEDFGIEHTYRDATKLLDLWREIQPPSENPFADVNMKARLRSVIATQEANNRDMLRAGTFNRSEDVLNAFTDGLSGANVSLLNGLYKTEVIGFGRYIGVPDYVLDKKPCGSELGNRDEDLYGVPFTTGLDAVLFMMHDRSMKPEEIHQEYKIDLDWLKRIERTTKSQDWRLNGESLTREAFAR